ncbi:MAG: N-acetylmuramoyl-L-alanine amidase [Pseudomonadota bacterium]
MLAVPLSLVVATVSLSIHFVPNDTTADGTLVGVGEVESAAGADGADGVEAAEEGVQAAEEEGAAPDRTGALLVMLDPGHGGSNTGAPGVIEGVYEKRLTLALAGEIARRLAGQKGIAVVLTRETDEYVTLRERVRLANRARADVFVSLHANASPTHTQQGYETFILTPEALEVDARVLRGNDGPVRPGVEQGTAFLLDDIERGIAHLWSLKLAQKVQARLAVAFGPEGNRGIKQASLDVLLGLTMPGVLVEVGFIDHRTEGIQLLRREVRAAIAGALAEAILDFARSLRWS